MIRILIGKPDFYDWLPYFEIIQKLFPLNIFLFDFETNDINELIEIYNIDAVLALTLKDMEMLSKLDLKCKILNNKNYNTVEICDNKCIFFDFFIKNNLENFIPDTFIIKKDGINYNKDIIYPAILKTAIGVGGKNIFILKNEDDLNKLKLTYDYLIQEYLIDKNEYNGHFFCINGSIYYYLFNQMHFDSLYYIKKGPVKENFLVDIDISDFDFIVKKLNYTGPINFNFKIINNKIYVLEINPRFGGSFVKSPYLHDLFYALINLNLDILN
jgi:carbamoyl-phosphate synthase large subunit